MPQYSPSRALVAGQFEREYKRLFGSDDTLPQELRALLADYYESRVGLPLDLEELKAALVRLFAFLASGRGRTDENCRAVGVFLRDYDFPTPADYSGGYEEWDLPEDFTGVISDAASTLHDTITRPDVASDMGASPEQLLERARRLRP